MNFAEVWVADFEFSAPPGERPDPVCLVALELRSGRKVRLWRDELRNCPPPYPLGSDALFVSYFASAELGCHLALGWPLPERVVDLFAEFRVATNGRRVHCGRSLVGALAWHGLPAMDASEKESMRQLILSGPPWSEEQRREILLYCESDVDAAARLLQAMLPKLDLKRALLRGRYSRAVAAMEHTGTPLDTVTLAQLTHHWDGLKDALIAAVDRDYGVFDGRTFKLAKFAAWLTARDIPWPRLPTGQLALDDRTFRDMAKAHPAVSPLRELRSSLSQLRLNELAVGRDGRNRTLLSPFGTKTGRNTPGNSKFIFGPSVWLRGLIQAPPGRAVAYLDWSSAEFGVAAALSGDANMQAAYASGDPYLAFAKRVKAVPADATKATHGPVREQYKQVCLGVQFGMGAESLAQRIGRPVLTARDLLSDHKRAYAKFWAWSDGAADRFAMHGKLWTVFGWPLYAEAGNGDGERTARNFPVQGNASEMLRLAACYMTERGLQIDAPIHDAVLLEAPEDELDGAVTLARQCMARASADVLSGFTLRTDYTVYRHPDRYMDGRGERMWRTVMQLVSDMCRDAPTKCMGAPAMCTSAAGVPSYL